LVLTDGQYFEDVETKKKKKKLQHPFAKAKFDTYIINIEVPDNDKDLEAERDISTDKMKNVSRLSKDIDSLKKDNTRIVQFFSKNVSKRIGVFQKIQPKDSLAKKTKRDSTFVDMHAENFDLLSSFTDFQKIQILNSAKNNASNILNTIRGKKEELKKRYKIYNLHILSLHKKYALAFSCIILFFVGAPLGAIIRKGGLGLPMVIAIILFLVYYFIGVFAGNYSKEGNIHPIIGAWLSTLIMLPLGFFLTKRATADKGMLNVWGIIVDFFKKIVAKKNKRSVT